MFLASIGPGLSVWGLSPLTGTAATPMAKVPPTPLLAVAEAAPEVPLAPSRPGLLYGLF